jgi:hypothetical protein
MEPEILKAFSALIPAKLDPRVVIAANGKDGMARGKKDNARTLNPSQALALLQQHQPNQPIPAI